VREHSSTIFLPLFLYRSSLQPLAAPQYIYIFPFLFGGRQLSLPPLFVYNEFYLAAKNLGKVLKSLGKKFQIQMERFKDKYILLLPKELKPQGLAPP
jgi:hypothetical protein